MDTIKFNKIARTIANDKDLQSKLQSAKSKEAVYTILKGVDGIRSKKDAEEFLQEAYDAGSSKVLVEDQLAEVSGGSFRGFMATCMLGITLLPVVGSLTSQMNTASAWGSGGLPISYDSRIPGLAQKLVKIQSSHEKITVASYLNGVLKKGQTMDSYLNKLKKIPMVLTHKRLKV